MKPFAVALGLVLAGFACSRDSRKIDVGEENKDTFNQEVAAADEELAKKDALARREAKEREFRQSVNVVLFDMLPAKFTLGRGFTLHLVYENPGAKDVRAFEGHLVLRDSLGNEAADIGVKSLTPLKAGEKAKAKQMAPFSVYEKLRDKKLPDLKAEWRPTRVIFSDGSTLSASGSE